MDRIIQVMVFILILIGGLFVKKGVPNTLVYTQAPKCMGYI